MDLVLPTGVEANVSWRSLTADTEGNSVTSTGTSILVLVSVKPSKISLLSINDYTQVVSLRRIPTVDLVEVERKLNGVSIAWDLVINLERVARSTVILSVTSEELGEDGCTIDPSVGPSEKRSILEVLLVDLDLWCASPGCRADRGVACRSGNGVTSWLGDRLACWLRDGVACWPWNGVACWLRNGVACWLRNGVESTAAELGRDADVVKARTLVVERLTESSLEHDLEFSVTVE